MGRVTVELTGDEARLLRALDRVIAKERQLGQEVGRVSEGSARGVKEISGGLQGVDREFGAIMRSGRNMLGLFGIGGGIAGAVTGAVALIAREAEQARKSLESLGQLQLGIGKGELGLGTIGGAGAPRAVEKLAAELGLPKEKVSASYAKFAAQGLSSGAAVSQARRELVESMGGPGYEKRRAETIAASPQAELAAIVQDIEGRREAELKRPRTREAQLQHARAYIATVEKEMKNLGAAQLGYTSAEEAGARAERVAVTMIPEYRKRLGLPEYNRPSTTIGHMLEGREGLLEVSKEDLGMIADKLLQASEAQQRAAGTLERAANNMETSQRPSRG